MPSINIREIDRTGAETVTQNDFITLVPGVYLEYKTIDPLTKKTTWEVFEGVLSETSQFKQEFRFGVTEEESGSEDILPKWFYQDSGFQTAYRLVSRGMTVFYKGAYTYEDPEASKISETEKRYLDIVDPITGQTSEELTEDAFFKQFSDKGKYNLRFITVGGFDINYVKAGVEAIKCAGNRGDAVALVDVPAKGTVPGDESGMVYEDVSLSSADLIDAWVQYSFGDIAATAIRRVGVSWESTEETYGRYGAIFGPEILCRWSTVDPTGKEKTVTGTIKLPASVNYLICFKQMLAAYPEWFATAGSSRGVSPLTNLVPTLPLGDSDIGLLQPRSGEENLGHLATNVICNIPPYGNIIWGNRTLHPLGKPVGLDDAAVQLTASSFLNIRQLCCTLKKVLYRASRRFSFDPNSDTLWFNFKNAIVPTLEKMKSNQGIRGYQIVPVTTNKKALLVAKIIINPIEAVEDFDLDVILSDNIEITEA